MPPHLADAAPAVVDETDANEPGAFGDALVNLVAGEPGQLAVIVEDHHLGLAVLEPGERLVAKREQLGGAHRAGSTRTLRNRHGAAP